MELLLGVAIGAALLTVLSRWRFKRWLKSKNPGMTSAWMRDRLYRDGQRPPE